MIKCGFVKVRLQCPREINITLPRWLLHCKIIVAHTWPSALELTSGRKLHVTHILSATLYWSIYLPPKSRFLHAELRGTVHWRIKCNWPQFQAVDDILRNIDLNNTSRLATRTLARVQVISRKSESVITCIAIIRFLCLHKNNFINIIYILNYSQF